MRIRTAGVIAALAAVLVAVLAAAGCTGGNVSPKPSASASSRAALVIWADDRQAAALAPVAAQYGKQHGLTVDVRGVSDDRQGQFVAASAAGRPPDIVLGGSDWIGNLVRHGAIDPVPLTGAQKSAFVDISIKAVTFNGAVYGVPYTVENVALIRNTDLAPLAPTTIQEAAAIGDQLQVAGIVTQPVAYPVGQDGDFRTVYPLYASAGGSVFGVKANGEYNTGDLTVGQPASVAAFATIGSLGEKGSGALVRSVTSANAMSLFAAQHTPYLVIGSDMLPELKHSGVAYDISPVPPFADGKPAPVLVGSQAFFVASKGANRAAAQDFVANEATRADVAKALYDVQPFPPALTAVVDQIRAVDPDAQKFLDVAKTGVVLPAIPEMGAVWAALGQAEAAVVGGADPPESADAAVTAIRAVLP